MQAEHLDGDAGAGDPALRREVVAEAELAGTCCELVDHRLVLRDEADIDRPSLIGQRHQCIVPALPRLPDEVLDRHRRVVEEDLAELLVAPNRANGHHRHTRRAHVDDERTDAAVAGVGFARTHEAEAQVGPLRVARPRLLPAHAIAAVGPDGRIGACSRAQRCKIRAGVWFGEPLAPELVAAEEPGQIARLLLGGREQQHGPRDEPVVEAGRHTRALGFLGEDRFLHRTHAAATHFDGPRQAGVAGGMELRVPGNGG